MQNLTRLPNHSLPVLSVPTAFAWLLLLSMFGAKPGERLAELAAGGAERRGENWEKVRERYRKTFRRAHKGHSVRASTEVAILSDTRDGVRAEQRKTFPPERAERLVALFKNVAGPFTALAGFVSPETPTPAHQRLFEFSAAMDRLGENFSNTVEQDDLPRARTLLLGSKALDDAYWEAPELGLSNAAARRTALRGANDWEQLIRTAAPLVLNVTLSWLAMLDVATLSAGKHGVAGFSLFRPLLTEPTVPALPGTQEADRRRLPVANLIRMLEDIAAYIEGTRRAPVGRNNRNRGEQAELRIALKVFKRHDLLSWDQFNSLLGRLAPEPEPREGEGCGFDVYALLLASNVFSLLTPRDAGVPTNAARRKVPERIICFPEARISYDRWWCRNRGQVAGDAIERPRPVWLPR